MKFSTVATTLALPLLAVATPWGTPTSTVKTTTITVTSTATPTVVNQCSTGSVQCCNSVQQSDAGGLVSVLLGLLGVVLDAVVPIGITCSPITVIGVSGTSCSAQTVCCDNDTFNGVIAIGCTPININL